MKTADVYVANTGWQFVTGALESHFCSERCGNPAAYLLRTWSGHPRYFCEDHLDFAYALVDGQPDASGRTLLRATVLTQ